MQDKELQLFEFTGKDIRSYEKDGQIWFVAKDVADILGYSGTEAMTRRLDEDESMSYKLSGMNMNSILINESGLYNAIFGSTKQGAKTFKRWVTSEVLPSIRKTGEYKISNTIKSLENQIGLLNKKINYMDPKKELYFNIMRVGRIMDCPTASTGGMDELAMVVECEHGIKLFQLYFSMYGTYRKNLNKFIDMINIHGLYDEVNSSIKNIFKYDAEDKKRKALNE